MSDRARWIGTVLLVALLVWSKSGGGLPVPDVQPGARMVFIVHESGEQTPALGSLVVNLRKAGTAQAYLASKGHKLIVVDDDLATRWNLTPKQLPALIIMDENAKVLFEQAIPANYTADNVIERIRENGG